MKIIAELYFEAAAAAVTPDPEVEVGSPKVTVLELGLGHRRVWKLVRDLREYS